MNLHKGGAIDQQGGATRFGGGVPLGSMGGSLAKNPPITNKGGNFSDPVLNQNQRWVGVSVDWLSLTISYEHLPNIETVLRGASLSLTGERLQNMKGYNNTVALWPAGSLSWHTEHHQHKLFINFSGAALSLLAASGITPLAVITYFTSLEAKFTRIDLAVDVKTRQEFAPVSDLYWTKDLGSGYDYEKALVRSEKTHLQDGKKIKLLGETVYIGSRSSRRFLRVYNKASEQFVTDYFWTRIEMVCRQDYAGVIASLLLEKDLETVTRSAITSMIDPPDITWWGVVFEAFPMADIPSIGRKQKDTERWLMSQVLPAAKKLAAGGSTVVQDFLNLSAREVPLADRRWLVRLLAAGIEADQAREDFLDDPHSVCRPASVSEKSTASFGGYLAGWGDDNI